MSSPSRKQDSRTRKTTSTRAPSTPRAARNEHVRHLLQVVHTVPSETRREAAREELVELHAPLVSNIARRVAQRVDEVQDLTQVGMIGLLRAIDGFDISRGFEFSTFAVPTITGEIRRHVRDTGWMLRVPRRAKELQFTVRKARERMTHDLCREPTIAEVAEALEVPEEHVRDVDAAASSQSNVSIDGLDDEQRPTAFVTRRLAADETGFEQAELRAMLSPALANLPAQQREVILLRFVHDHTQAEIARMIGVSQMQVSRLLGRALQRLRLEIGDRAA